MSAPQSHLRYAGPQIRDRDVNELEGLIRGIALDGRIVPAEAESLRRWCEAKRDWHDGSLFREARERINEAISDGVLDEEERADILHFCERLRSPNPYYAAATKDMQRLHGLLAGIGADGIVTADELRALREWMESVENLKGTWPYDEVDSIITAVLADGRVDEQEQEFLLGFTREFLEFSTSLAIEVPCNEDVRLGICAVQPDISFAGRMFCVTGSSPRAFRREIEGVVIKLGGRAHPRVVQDLDYLIVAAERTHSWAFSCYGRKVEQAMALRKEGRRIAIVHESDFWDAAADHGHRGPRLYTLHR